MVLIQAFNWIDKTTKYMFYHGEYIGCKNIGTRENIIIEESFDV